MTYLVAQFGASVLIKYGLVGIMLSYVLLWIMGAWYGDHIGQSDVSRKFDNDLRYNADYGAHRQQVGLFAGGQAAYYRRYNLHYLLWSARAVLVASILLIAASLVWGVR